MRKNDPAQIFKRANCATGCPAKWSKWCPHCNLVFCANHIIPSEHKCGEHQQDRIFPELIPEPKKPKKKRAARKKPEAKPAEKPTKPTLQQGPPTANGTAVATPESEAPQR